MQLCAVIRMIHCAGLAARVIHPSKVIVQGKSKIMLSGCGIHDVLTFEQTQANPALVIQQCQQEDLTALGHLILGRFGMQIKTALYAITVESPYLNPRIFLSEFA